MVLELIDYYIYVKDGVVKVLADEQIVPIKLSMRIQRKYDDLSAAEKKVADVVMLLNDNILDYSIADLAEKCKVSEPTVVRFCRSIGLSGIKELKKAAVQKSYSDAHPVNMEIEQLKSNEQLVPFIINNLSSILEETQKMISEPSVQKAIDLLVNSSYVKVVGLGGSSIVARHIQHYLRMAGMHVDLFCNYEDCYPTLREEYHVGDVVIAISYSGNSTLTLDAVRDAKDKGASIVCITSWGESKLNELADVSLTSYYHGDGIIPGTHVFERISQLAIADMLIAGLYMEKQNKQ